MKFNRLIKSIALFLGLSFAWMVFILAWHQKQAAPLSGASNGFKKLARFIEQSIFETIHAQQQEFSTSEYAYSSLLLTDSVITIAKNYYVDPSRVMNHELLKTTINGLKGTKGLSVSAHGSLVTLSGAGRWLDIELSTEQSQDQLLSTLVKISSFLDATVFSEQKSGEQKGVYHVLGRLVAGLDAHSNILSKEAYRDLREGTEGTFGGLGVLVGMRDELLTVIKPIPSSPAARVGIKGKDKILAIDGKPTFGSSLSELVETMRGFPGTRVNLSLLRDEDLVSREVSLRREVINVDSVSASPIKTKYGWILRLSIESFTARTAEEIVAAIAKFKADPKLRVAKGIILDLRSNPGGLLDQAVEVSDLFLSRGVIVSTKGKEIEVERAHDQGLDDLDDPVIVLINEDSASASEIVAGALQDHDRALVVGQPSFGKGSVQTIFELPEKRALKLTIARYYTPKGISIQNVGIYPDVWLHPVGRKKTNNNLLGEYRYKTEKYLRHRLNSPSVKTGEREILAHSLFNGYFTQTVGDDFDLPTSDYELEIALVIFSQVFAVYDGAVPKVNSRASHVLSLAREKLQKRLATDSRSVATYLEREFSIDWSGAQTELEPNDLSFFLAGDLSNTVEPGDTLELPFKLNNLTQKQLNRLSVFIRSEDPNFATIEQLVGTIAAKTSFAGQLTVEIPNYWPTGSLNLEFGLACDGQVVPHVSQSLPLRVTSRESPKLDISFEMVGENGGRLRGVLEPEEHGQLAVALRNTSLIDAGSLKVSLKNLAGQQIEVSKTTKIVEGLGPGKKQTIFFDIAGARYLLSERLDLGILVEGKSLNQAMKQRAAVVSLPSKKQQVPQSRRSQPLDSPPTPGGQSW